mgnify:CR=1 FL=1
MKLPNNFPNVSDIPENIDDYLEQKESEVSDIYPYAEKTVFWNNSNKNKTKYSIVFIHGFTTTGYQSKEFLNKLSAELNANLFVTRLSGHGVPYEGTKQMQIDKIMYDVVEAIIIGERIGENVILIGHSLGGALSMLAANDELLSKKIDTLVLFAPGNSGISPFAFMNTLISSLVDRTGSLCWLIDCDPRSFMDLPEDEKWENYLKIVPKDERDNIMEAYGKRIEGKYGNKTKDKFMFNWARWEEEILSLVPKTEKQVKKELLKDNYYKSIAKMEYHYFKNNLFIPNNFLKNKKKYKLLKNIPVEIIHGRYDMVCPPYAAYELHQLIPHSKLHFTIAGHTVTDEENKKKLIEITNKYV